MACTEMKVYAQNIVGNDVFLQQNEEAISDSQDTILEDTETSDSIFSEETDDSVNTDENTYDKNQASDQEYDNFQEDLNENNETFSEGDTVSKADLPIQNAEEVLMEEDKTALIEQDNQVETEEIEVLEELLPSETRITTEPERERYKIYAELVEEDIDMSR